MTMQPNSIFRLSITHLGGLGDGIGTHQGTPVYVPFTAPGDEAQVRILSAAKQQARGELVELLTPSTQRAEPACIHFTQCGGCTLQHLNDQAYQDFKQSILTRAVHQLGYDASSIRPLITTPAHSRRRADFTLQRHKDTLKLGFLMPGSYHVVDLAMCPVLNPMIFALLAPLRNWASTLAKPQRIESIAITQADHGLDMVLHLREKLSADDTDSIQHFCTSQASILRLSTQMSGEHYCQSLYETQPVTMQFGNAQVALPPGAFLQASPQGQDALTALVLEHTAGATRIADIYSGCGTYSFPLASRGQKVHGYEGTTDMVQAAQTAARRSGMEDHAQFSVRDLFRTPLTTQELQQYDTVVINPPRNGAEPQFRNIAKSGIPHVVVVSCNPATFARDAKALKAAGYALDAATGVDQFLWSGHLELVAKFTKSAA
jgi:23S rRNA (uracil1939-C5)-methyltransferase